MAADLLFYRSFKLLRATSHTSIPPYSAYYLVRKNGSDFEIIVPQGYKEDVQGESLIADVVLDSKSTVVEYVTFILSFIYTEHGALRLIDDFFDESMLTGPATEEQLNKFEEIVRPARIKETENGFEIDAIIFYGDHVFISVISVKTNGIVDIEKEEILAADMPIKPIFLK